MLTIQNYVRPQTLEEAWNLNRSKKNRILGGMLWLRLGRGSINTAIDLAGTLPAALILLLILLIDLLLIDHGGAWRW